ncbi:MAG: SH3 domain-containing protein [Hydrogenophilales bacterium]|nr:SH3 domain-containing protein [Hydrogenophilales bacterium]
MMLTELLRGGLLIGLALASARAEAVTGVMLRDDDMRAAAGVSATKVALAKKGKIINVLARRGGWTQIQLGTVSGWVRLLSVRRGPASRTDYQGSLGSAENAANSPHDTGSITATSGLRGLDLVDLSAAKFDAKQLEQLERHASVKADAMAFAAQAGLTARSLAYLPAPPQNTFGGLDVFGGQ